MPAPAFQQKVNPVPVVAPESRPQYGHLKYYGAVGKNFRTKEVEGSGHSLLGYRRKAPTTDQPQPQLAGCRRGMARASHVGALTPIVKRELP